MADIDLEQGRILPHATVLRWVDMGGGIHAALRSVDGSTVALVENTGVYLIDSDGVNVGLRHIDNKLLVTCTPYLYDIARGNIPGRTAVSRYGHNEDVGIAAETVSHIGAVMYYPVAAEILKIKSDDVDDDGDPAGTGARTAWLEGLDNNYAIITDTITLNGTTAVDTNKAFLRVFKMMVMAAGTSGTNEGMITAYGNDGTSKINAIYDGENESHSASFTVPAGQTLHIIDLIISDASLKGTQVDLYARPFGGLWYLKRPYSILGGTTPLPLSLPLVFAEKTDIEVRAIAILAGAVVNAGFDGWREDN